MLKAKSNLSNHILLYYEYDINMDTFSRKMNLCRPPPDFFVTTRPLATRGSHAIAKSLRRHRLNSPVLVTSPVAALSLADVLGLRGVDLLALPHAPLLPNALDSWPLVYAEVGEVAAPAAAARLEPSPRPRRELLPLPLKKRPIMPAAARPGPCPSSPLMRGPTPRHVPS